MGAFVRASTSALLAYPDVNAYIDGNETVYRCPLLPFRPVRPHPYPLPSPLRPD